MVDPPRAGREDGAMPERSVEEHLAACEVRYREVAAQLSGIGLIASGSLARRSHRCGRPNCACQADPPRPHGPYWHWTAKVAGKTVNRRLSDEEAVLYQEWIANDRRLRSLVDELRRIAREAIELSLAAAKTEQMCIRDRAERRPVPDWRHVHRELHRGRHVTLRLLWLEWRQDQPDGWGYTQFCVHYRAWLGTQDVVMRLEYPAGARMLVDYSGCLLYTSRCV